MKATPGNSIPAKTFVRTSKSVEPAILSDMAKLQPRWRQKKQYHSEKSRPWLREPHKT